MSLTILPPEVLAIVVQNLDTASIHNLYESKLVSLQGLVKEFHFSFNTFATAKVLETNFFRDTSRNLRVLNMCCARDLECPTLLGAMRYLPNLTDLDVSYTKIKMPDFLRFADMAPKLTSIAINFSFGEGYEKKLRRSALMEYQEAFKQFKYVTLVSSPFAMYETFRMKLAMMMLQKADLLKLQFEFGHGPTIDRCEVDYEDMEMPSLSELHVHQLRSKGNNHLPIFELMNFTKYEIAIFKTDFLENDNESNQCLYVTPFLKQFIPDDYHVKVEVLLDHRTMSAQEYNKRVQEEFQHTYGLENAFIFYEKSRTIFDEEFYFKLYKVLQAYTVFSCKSTYLSQISEVPTAFNWYNIHHVVPPDALRRNKVFEIDYGFAFKQHVDVKLNLKLDYHPEAVPRMLNNFDFLNKLSHLSLTSSYNYDSDFFKTIFLHCVKLETLQLIGADSYNPIIFQHISLSKTLKNLLIQRIKESLNIFFAYLSECHTLENICVFMCSLDLPNPTNLFKNCKNLYNLSIYAGVDDNFNYYPAKISKESYLKVFGVIKDGMGRHAINVDIQEYSEFIHNPFIRVFSVFQLEPL